MCGICGIIESNGAVNPEKLKKMMRLINHRGPDENGHFLEGGVALGHARLKIIDLSTGGQPIYNEDNTKCIIFNGEIYNYAKLRKELIGRGHQFSTRTDTEVILHLFEDEGVECVNRLRGMFSFCIWDRKKKELFIARDRLGIKPLYYSHSNGRFIFASEIKAILGVTEENRELNIQSLDQYITLNYTIGPETMLKGITKLMPGHYLVYSENRLITKQYWDFNHIQETQLSFSECFEKMEKLIEESISLRLMSDVPLGAFLSGGVDSSVTVGVMTQLMGKPVQTFTVGYESDDEENELHYAKIVADTFRSNHHEFILKPRKFMDIVSKVIWHLDEPVAEIATIPLLLLSELAKEHVTVILSGEGADEIFAGYPIYRYMNYIQHYHKIPQPIRDTVLTPIIAKFLKDKKQGKYLDWINAPLEERYIGNGSYFTRRMKESLYTERFKESLNRESIYQLIASYYQSVSGKNAIQQMLYMDTKTWLPEDLLIKADKMTMAAALELRVPFLDHHLVEFATSLPTHMKANWFNSKYIFKKYAEKMLPKSIVYRKKKGFPVPLQKWLRQDLNTIAKEILLDERTKKRDILDMEYIRKMFQLHDSGADLSKNIWNLLILEMWMRIYLDGDGR